MVKNTRPDLTLLTNPKFKIHEVSTNSEMSIDDWDTINNAAKRLPQLIQIAEMYFDSMVGTDSEKGMVFKMVSDTLNEIKN